MAKKNKKNTETETETKTMPVEGEGETMPVEGEGETMPVEGEPAKAKAKLINYGTFGNFREGTVRGTIMASVCGPVEQALTEDELVAKLLELFPTHSKGDAAKRPVEYLHRHAVRWITRYQFLGLIGRGPRGEWSAHIPWTPEAAVHPVVRGQVTRKVDPELVAKREAAKAAIAAAKAAAKAAIADAKAAKQ